MKNAEYKFPLIARNNKWGFEVTFESETKGHVSKINILVDHVIVGEHSNRWISCFNTDYWTIISHDLNKPTLEDLRRQEKEIQDKIKEIEAEGSDWPKEGNQFWMFDFEHLKPYKYEWDNNAFYRRVKYYGNVHPTEKAAKEWGEKWINRMKEEMNKKI